MRWAQGSLGELRQATACATAYKVVGPDEASRRVRIRNWSLRYKCLECLAHRENRTHQDAG